MPKWLKSLSLCPFSPCILIFDTISSCHGLQTFIFRCLQFFLQIKQTVKAQKSKLAWSSQWTEGVNLFLSVQTWMKWLREIKIICSEIINWVDNNDFSRTPCILYLRSLICRVTELNFINFPAKFFIYQNNGCVEAQSKRKIL